MVNVPRGIRNNNPGNIRKGQPWKGLAESQTDSNFDQFTSPEYGIRAIVKIIVSYTNRGMDSVAKIINTWAPTNENDTASYIKAVSDDIGVGPDDCLNLKDTKVWLALVKAIIRHENGQQPYTDAVILNGINLALVYSEIRSINIHDI